MEEPPRAADASAVSAARIIRLRSVMPEESPIDLDEHTALIAYALGREGTVARNKAQVQGTRVYVQEVRHFLTQVRRAVGPVPVPGAPIPTLEVERKPHR